MATNVVYNRSIAIGQVAHGLANAQLQALHSQRPIGSYSRCIPKYKDGRHCKCSAVYIHTVGCAKVSNLTSLVPLIKSLTTTLVAR